MLIALSWPEQMWYLDLIRPLADSLWAFPCCLDHLFLSPVYHPASWLLAVIAWLLKPRSQKTWAYPILLSPTLLKVRNQLFSESTFCTWKHGARQEVPIPGNAWWGKKPFLRPQASFLPKVVCSFTLPRTLFYPIPVLLQDIPNGFPNPHIRGATVFWQQGLLRSQNTQFFQHSHSRRVDDQVKSSQKGTAIDGSKLSWAFLNQTNFDPPMASFRIALLPPGPLFTPSFGFTRWICRPHLMSSWVVRFLRWRCKPYWALCVTCGPVSVFSLLCCPFISWNAFGCPSIL